MDECFKDAADEQLVLLVYKNLVPAYYELFDRCRFYIKKCASDVQSLYKPINYDEGEINLCLTRAFKESINSFNFKQSFFKNYFIRLFRRYYVAEVKERAEKEQKEYSLEEYLSPEADTKYNDVIDDGRDYYQEFYDLVTKKEILSKLKTTLDVPLRAKAIVLYKYSGYTFREISKIMKLSVKQIRTVLENPKLKYKIKLLTDQMNQIYGY